MTDVEAIRRAHRPEPIATLFVGESRRSAAISSIAAIH